MSAHNDVIKQLREAIICNFDLAAISTVEAKNTINEAKTLIDHVELLRDQQGQLEGWKYFLHLFTVEVQRSEVPFLSLQKLINQLFWMISQFMPTYPATPSAERKCRPASFNPTSLCS